MHHSVSALLAQSMRTLLVGSGGGACQGKLARRRGSYQLSCGQTESWKWVAAGPDPGSPKSLDCMSAVQRWHKQGSVNERETDFTTNSLAVVGGGGGGHLRNSLAWMQLRAGTKGRQRNTERADCISCISGRPLGLPEKNSLP